MTNNAFNSNTSIDLSTLLRNHDVILFDGAMATQLAERGLPMGGQNNIFNPNHVLSIHQSYSQCGCHILTANTLTMNRLNIESHNLDVDFRDVNLAGVRLAKQAAQESQYVFGNLSSTGKLLKPIGNLTENEAYESFKEQAVVLVQGGADGLLIETMIDLNEAIIALQACTAIASLPVIVSMAFTTLKNGGRTIMGDTAEKCAKALTESGAQAIGANCGKLDPWQTAQIVSTLRDATDLPIIAQPNAGSPKWIDGKSVFDMPPDEFTKGIIACIHAGARLVGGCCGTSPAHIRAIAQNIFH